VKTYRPLPDLDLARIGPLPRDQKRFQLQKMKLIPPPHSLQPVRKNCPDILSITTGLFDDSAVRTPWDKIKENIIRVSNNDKPHEANINVRVGEALYKFAEEHKIRGRYRDEFFPLSIGVSEKVTYWFKAVFAVDDIETVLFMDPRRDRLDYDGSRFVFSVIHERLSAYPDFRKTRLGILEANSFGKSSRRWVRFVTNEGVKLFTFDELDAMVRETYDLWREILEERDDELRRRSGGATGTLI